MKIILQEKHSDNVGKISDHHRPQENKTTLSLTCHDIITTNTRIRHMPTGAREKIILGEDGGKLRKGTKNERMIT